MRIRQGKRLFRALFGAAATCAMCPAVASGEVPPAPVEGMYSELKDLGDHYRFAIIADPQVGHASDRGRIAATARERLERAVGEINAIADPPVSFTVFLGDMVNVPDDRSWANFLDGIADLEPTPVFVHGNHDTKYPYTKFRAVQRELAGYDAMYYSFDAGGWHYVVLPDNLFGNSPELRAFEGRVLEWMRRDLAEHRSRPTMVFSHRHLLPGGLSQLEWYTHRRDLRVAILDAMSEHGNVRHHFNGHVHNGVKAADKMAFRYEGINMLTVPTVIAGRPFGEEYAPFRDGYRNGGYYVVVDVRGEDVTCSARLVGTPTSHTFASVFPRFERSMEPRWWRLLPEFEPLSSLENGSFEAGLDGWYSVYRYMSDELPGYVAKTVEGTSRDGAGSAFVQTREKGQDWAEDEYTEVYQVVRLPAEGPAVVRASYMLPETPSAGGGWIRLAAMGDGELKAMFMFRWGDPVAEANSAFVPQAFGHSMTGRAENWLYLNQLAEQGRGLFWQLPDAPGRWHDLVADLEQLYDAAMGETGAFDELGATAVMIGVGTYTDNSQPGAKSSAYFDALELEHRAAVSTINGERLVVDKTVFETLFGRSLENRVNPRVESVPQGPGVNLLVNGDLRSGQRRDGTPVAWHRSSTGWSVIDDAGDLVFHLAPEAGASADFRSHRVPFGFDMGVPVRIGWRWRYDISEGFGNVELRWYDRRGRIIGQTVERARGSAKDWSRVELGARAPAGAVAFDVLVLLPSGTLGTLSIDDMRVEVVEP